MFRTALDPELRRIAALLPRGIPGERLVQLDRRFGPLIVERPPPSGTEVLPVGAVTVRLHQPPDAPDAPLPALLWIHGGGYIAGYAAQDDAFCRMLARDLRIRVAAVEYRRAPEHPYPTPLHDCHDALVWLAQRDDVDADRVAIGGGSAGGGLAAGLAQLARDRARVRPVLQLLSYPMLDDRTACRADIDERDLRLWDNRSNRFGWQSYLGRPPGTDPDPGAAVPARHDDLSDLAPAWVGVGSCDLFFEEDVAYARRLHDAGVPCELHVARGGFHAFDQLRPDARLSRDFRGAQLRALRSALLPD